MGRGARDARRSSGGEGDGRRDESWRRRRATGDKAWRGETARREGGTAVS